MAYANRVVEFHKVKTAIESSDAAAIFILGSKESGLSSFLEEIKHHLGSSCFVYVHLDEDNTSFRDEFGKAVYKENRDEFQKHVDKELGEYSWPQLFAGMIRAVPFIGEPVAATIDFAVSEKAPPLYIGDYFSLMDEAVLSFLPKLDKRIIIVVDRAENISETSFDFISGVLQKVEDVRFLFAFRESNASALKLRNYVGGIKCAQCEVPFKKTNGRLVSEIAKLFDLSIDDEEANSILCECEGSIHSIVFQLKTGDALSKVQLNDFEKRLIAYMSLWRKGLSVDDIALLNKAHHIGFEEAFAMAEETLYQFVQDGIMNTRKTLNDDTYYFLCSYESTIVKDVLSDYGLRLICARDLYRYFEKPVIKTATYDEIKSLFLLSSEYEIEETAALSVALIRSGLASGNCPPKAALDSLPATDESNFLKAIQLTKNREYSQGLLALNEVSTAARDNNYHKLRAIILNRTRNHEIASRELSLCIESEKAVSCRNILLAFQLVNYIHMERLSEALALFKSEYKKLLGTENAGYFFRNATSLFHDQKTKQELFVLAMESFTKYNDTLGYGTVLSNKATSIIKQGKEHVDSALELLNKARSILDGAGPEHLFPLYNSFGLSYLAAGKLEDALWSFQQSKVFSRDSMPTVLSAINEAITRIRMGQPGEALTLLRGLNELVKTHPVNRVRQLYYPHLALAYFSAKQPVPLDLIDSIRDNPDRYFPERTQSLVEFYSSAPKQPTSLYTLDTLAAPCSIVYWYVNPLKALSGDVLNHPLAPHA